MSSIQPHDPNLSSQSKDRMQGQEMRVEVSDQNCAKTIISNISTKLYMTHIQRFLSNSLPAYILHYAREHVGTPQFRDPENGQSIFVLVGELVLLAAERCGRGEGGQWVREWMFENLLVKCEALRKTRVELVETDTELLNLLKTSLQYIYMRMLQIEVRLLILYIEGMGKEEVSDEMGEKVKEICEIYPALKAEVSIMHPEVSLVKWFERCLDMIKGAGPGSKAYHKALNMVRQEAELIGPMEALFKRHIACSSMEVEHSIMKADQISLPTRQISMKVEKARSPKATVKSSTFNEGQLFRKKKRIIKDRLKTSNVPLYQALTPSNLKTIPSSVSRTASDNKPVQQESTTFRHQSLRFFQSKKSTQRTLYHATPFVVARSSIPNPSSEPNGENSITFSSTTYESMNKVGSMSDRRMSQSMNQFQNDENDDINSFCVPATPRPQHSKVLSSEKQTLQMDQLSLL